MHPHQWHHYGYSHPTKDSSGLPLSFLYSLQGSNHQHLSNLPSPWPLCMHHILSRNVNSLLTWPPSNSYCNYCLSKFLKKFFCNVFIYFWDRERQSMSRGGAGREREEDTEPEVGSRLWAVSTEPDAGLELTDYEIITWAEVRRSSDWATQAPLPQ